jgi:hypothetical protein
MKRLTFLLCLILNSCIINAQIFQKLSPGIDTVMDDGNTYFRKLFIDIKDSIDEGFEMVLPQIAELIKKNSNKVLLIDFKFNNTTKQLLNGAQSQSGDVVRRIFHQLQMQGISTKNISHTISNDQVVSDKEAANSITIALMTREERTKKEDARRNQRERKRLWDKLRGNKHNKYITVKKKAVEQS